MSCLTEAMMMVIGMARVVIKMTIEMVTITVMTVTTAVMAATTGITEPLQGRLATFKKQRSWHG